MKYFDSNCLVVSSALLILNYFLCKQKFACKILHLLNKNAVEFDLTVANTYYVQMAKI